MCWLTRRDPLLARRHCRATDLQAATEDQITRYIQSQFSGHGLARLVAAILHADGYQTDIWPPGAEQGVSNILAGTRPCSGLESPGLLVQVKSGDSAANTTVYRCASRHRADLQGRPWITRFVVRVHEDGQSRRRNLSTFIYGCGMGDADSSRCCL